MQKSVYICMSLCSNDGHDNPYSELIEKELQNYLNYDMIPNSQFTVVVISYFYFILFCKSLLKMVQKPVAMFLRPYQCYLRNEV